MTMPYTVGQKLLSVLYFKTGVSVMLSMASAPTTALLPKEMPFLIPKRSSFQSSLSPGDDRDIGPRGLCQLSPVPRLLLKTINNSILRHGTHHQNIANIDLDLPSTVHCPVWIPPVSKNSLFCFLNTWAS